MIPTHDRAASLLLAVGDVLEQHLTDLEVIVVVDGSTDSTLRDLAAISDDRLRVVSRDNEGPCVARNAGAAAARGEWITFLDDDDRVDPDWLSIFDEHIDSTVGLVCVGAMLVGEDGAALGRLVPRELGPLYGSRVAQFAASTFAVRTSILAAAGGYDPLVTFGENYELGIRMIESCAAAGGRVATDDRCPVRWTRRSGRPTADRTRALYQGATRLLEKHAARLVQDPDAAADAHGIAGVNAARLGRNREARQHLARALLLRPTRWRAWPRALVAVWPPAARRMWGDHR